MRGRGRDDDRRCMHASSADKALELFCRVDQLANLLVAVVRFAQVRHIFEGAVDGHAHCRRNQLGNAIDVAIGHVERASAVFDRGLGRHGVEGDDLRYLLAAIFARDVVDHFAAAVLAEVDVDIGHRHALGIQEAFEEQHVLHRDRCW